MQPPPMPPAARSVCAGVQVPAAQAGPRPRGHRHSGLARKLSRGSHTPGMKGSCSRAFPAAMSRVLLHC